MKIVNVPTGQTSHIAEFAHHDNLPNVPESIRFVVVAGGYGEGDGRVDGSVGVDLLILVVPVLSGGGTAIRILFSDSAATTT